MTTVPSSSNSIKNPSTVPSPLLPVRPHGGTGGRSGRGVPCLSLKESKEIEGIGIRWRGRRRRSLDHLWP